MLTLIIIVVVAAFYLGSWWLVSRVDGAARDRTSATSVSSVRSIPQPSGQSTLPSDQASRPANPIMRAPWYILMGLGLTLVSIGYATGSTGYVDGDVGLGIAFILAGIVVLTRPRKAGRAVPGAIEASAQSQSPSSAPSARILGATIVAIFGVLLLIGWALY